MWSEGRLRSKPKHKALNCRINRGKLAHSVERQAYPLGRHWETVCRSTDHKENSSPAHDREHSFICTFTVRTTWREHASGRQVDQQDTVRRQLLKYWWEKGTGKGLGKRQGLVYCWMQETGTSYLTWPAEAPHVQVAIAQQEGTEEMLPTRELLLPWAAAVEF